MQRLQIFFRHRAIALLLSFPGILYPACFCQAQALKPEIFAPGIISGPVNDASPAFTPDGKTVYFCRSSPALGAVILVSHLEHGKWSKPELTPFSGRWRDGEPALAPDGSFLIFASNRPEASGNRPLDGFWSGKSFPLGMHFPERGGNLWRVDRKDNSWGEPHRLPDIINSSTATFSPSITADGSLYFMKPVPGTYRFHIYRAASRNGNFQEPVKVQFSAEDSLSDVDPVISPDESFIIFSSNRYPASNTQLFFCRRSNGNWGVPVSLGDSVNLSPGAQNIEARLGADHHTLYFSSDFVPAANYPLDRETMRQRLRMSEWETGSTNIWFVGLDPWLTNKQ